MLLLRTIYFENSHRYQTYRLEYNLWLFMYTNCTEHGELKLIY